MWFFGDRERTVEPRAVVAALEERLRELPGTPAGAERHGALAGLLVRAGELAQGVADAERAAAGADDAGPGERAALAGAAELARALWASWLAGGRSRLPAPGLLAPLAVAPLPANVSLRRPEGYAFYAAYPEAWAAAARALGGARATVLGIRSIGTSLAAMVAAGAGLGAPAATLRPVGDPFRRTLELGPALEALVAAGRHGLFAVADEGPGMSGSSFAAVLRALAARGVPPARVHLFPSHPGEPGPAAAPEARALYASAPRAHVAFEALFLGEHPLALPRLAADAIGPADAAPEDLSAGAWRGKVVPAGAPWPPSQGWRERRKYLLRAGGRTWLARFAGIGEAGQRAFARAKALAAGGLAPAPAALRHGFVFSPWLDARPLTAAEVPRRYALAAFRRHLAFVAAAFPARPGDGASPQALLAMAEDNARDALGPDAASGVERLRGVVAEVEATARPVAVDGKVDPWEWLLLRDGSIVKADALDHHTDHSIPGCQDALWDVAGVELAFDLRAEDGRALADAVRAAAPGAPPRLLPFYRVCRAAFEVGRWWSAAADGGVDAEEVARRQAALEHAKAGLRWAVAAR